MDQRLSLVTLAVRDVARSRSFYIDGLGWRAATYVPGEVLMLPVAERLVLSLWDAEAFAAEVGPLAPAGGVPPVTLAHNVRTPAEVDETLDAARRAGADPVREGQARSWGGYTGYFADPDGYHWEVAHNPGPIGELVLP